MGGVEVEEGEEGWGGCDTRCMVLCTKLKARGLKRLKIPTRKR